MAVLMETDGQFGALHKLFPVIGEHHLLEEEIK